jgi:hypothetical protein
MCWCGTLSVNKHRPLTRRCTHKSSCKPAQYNGQHTLLQDRPHLPRFQTCAKVAHNLTESQTVKTSSCLAPALPLDSLKLPGYMLFLQTQPTMQRVIQGPCMQNVVLQGAVRLLADNTQACKEESARACCQQPARQCLSPINTTGASGLVCKREGPQEQR